MATAGAKKTGSEIGGAYTPPSPDPQIKPVNPNLADPSFLLHVPLTSLFSPFLNIPQNVERVLGPPRNLATQYYQSFENGTQARALGRFTEEVYKLGAFDMAGRVWSHWRTKYEKNAEAEAAAEREAARERGGVKDSVGKNAKE